jgi:hypothetical protein
VDARRKIACTGFHGLARRQKSERRYSRNARPIDRRPRQEETIGARVFVGALEHKKPGIDREDRGRLISASCISDLTRLRWVRNFEEEGLTLSMKIAQVAPLRESKIGRNQEVSEAA